MSDDVRTDETARPVRSAAGTWDFALMVATVGLLGALGAQSLFGTLYAWWEYRADPAWESSGGYGAFIDVMNAVAAPLVIALVLVMGLCIPKRLFSRRALLMVSVAMVAAGALAGALSGSAATGLTVYLCAAGLIQVAVVALTLSGAEGLTYLSRGRLVKAGSGLLHLGFIGFAIVVVALQRSPLMLPVFYASATLLAGGSALAFYARPPAGGSLDAVEPEHSADETA